MYAVSSGNEPDSEPMFTEMLKDIRDSSQFCLGVNRIEACKNICDHIKRSQLELKRALLYMKNMVKGLHKLFKDVVNENLKVSPILGKSGSEVSYFPRT